MQLRPGTIALATCWCAVLCLVASSAFAAGPLKVGRYKLTAAELERPISVRLGQLGLAQPDSGASLAGIVTYGGTIWTSRGRLTLEASLSFSGRKPRALVAIDTNGDGLVTDESVVSGKLQGGWESSKYCTFILEPLKSGDLRGCTLTLEARRSAPKIAISTLVTRAKSAAIPRQGGKKCRVYYVQPSLSAMGGVGLCVDENGDGELQPCERLTGTRCVLGLGGKLRQLNYDLKSSVLAVSAVKQKLGKLACKLTDGRGHQTNPAQLTASIGGLTAVHVRPPAVVDMPTGTAYLTITVDLGNGREAQLSRNISTRIKSAGTTSIKVSGKINPGAGVHAAGPKQFQVSASPATRTGETLGGLVGRGDAGGTVKVFASDGTLVLLGALEFG